MAATTTAYCPPEQQALAFWEAQRSRGPVKQGIPEGYPERLDSPLAWTRSEILDKLPSLSINLDEREIESIEAALARFEEQSLGLSQISSETFILPEDLSRKLRAISQECYRGAGFGIIHGLDPTRYTDEQNVALYAGLAAHVAPQRGFLDRKCEKVLCHVVNVAGSEASEMTTKSPGFTNGPLSFHSDGCEILALYVLNTAEEGGRTLVSSSWQLYNELAKHRPDVLHTLSQDWVLDTFRDHSMFPPVKQPFLHGVKNDTLTFRFSRYPVTGFAATKRGAALPAVTQSQIEAIDAVHFMAAQNAVPLPLGRGDIVFINDMAILHGRESFSEHGTHLQRHLLKLYLRDPEYSWPVPVTELQQWNKVYGPNRPDGSRVEGWYIRHEPGQEDDWMRNG